jgi:hypothetical protein
MERLTDISADSRCRLNAGDDCSRAKQYETSDDYSRSEPPVHPTGKHHESDHSDRDDRSGSRNISEQRALQPLQGVNDGA